MPLTPEAQKVQNHLFANGDGEFRAYVHPLSVTVSGQVVANVAFRRKGWYALAFVAANNIRELREASAGEIDRALETAGKRVDWALSDGRRFGQADLLVAACDQIRAELSTVIPDEKKSPA